jgi:hypothetical protein
MCSSEFKARKEKCGKDKCDSEFIVANSVKAHAGKCFRCGTDRLHDDSPEDSSSRLEEHHGASLLPRSIGSKAQS